MSSISQTVLAPRTQRASGAVAVPKSKWRKYLPMYVSVAPYYIVYLAFGLIPTVFSLFLAFQKWDGVGEMSFVGFTNFYFALTDPTFGLAISNTLIIWVISTIPMLALALAMAFLLNLRGRSRIVYQLCYFIPNITSIVAITIIFNSMFGTQFGLINFVLTSLHLPAIAWLTEPWAMKWSVALMVIWRWTGYNALIYMAGLQSIPSEFYEAARTDGANTWSVFRHITVPLLRPVILFTVITSTIGGLTLFTEPQVLFGNPGGTGHEGLTMGLYQYWQTFASYHFGYGAAISWLIFIIMLIFTIVNWRIVQAGER